MAIANVQKQMLAGGKVNLVGDRELYNTAAELTRIMGHKNPDKFFNDPSAVNPQTGQLLHPPPAPPPPPPDPKMAAAQARAQTEQQRAQTAAIQFQVKTQAEIELARVKADLEARLALLEAHLKAAGAEQKMRHGEVQRGLDAAGAALGLMTAAQRHAINPQPMNQEPSQPHDG